jgi:hypothetical protein
MWISGFEASAGEILNVFAGRVAKSRI